MEFLISAGFDENEAQTALSQSNGDAQLAISLLIDSSGPSSSLEPSRALGSISDSINPTEENTERTISCEASQYTFGGGASACSSICVHAASRLLSGQDAPTFSSESLYNLVFEGVGLHNQVIAALGDRHLAVDEVLATSAGAQTTESLSVLASMLQANIAESDAFYSLLNGIIIQAQAQNGCTRVGVILTKPPETVLAILPIVPQTGVTVMAADVYCHGAVFASAQTEGASAQTEPGSDMDSNAGRNSDTPHPLYALFDSHARPGRAITGTHVVQFSTLRALCVHLHSLFPSMNLGPDVDATQALMYNTVEATVLRKK